MRYLTIYAQMNDDKRNRNTILLLYYIIDLLLYNYFIIKYLFKYQLLCIIYCEQCGSVYV